MLLWKSKNELFRKLEESNRTQDPWEGHIPVGKHVRQGDVYLNSVKCIPEKAKVLADGDSGDENNIQLAPGNTVGSRHILKVGKGIKVFQPRDNSDLLGVMFSVAEGVIAVVTHPEHREFRVKGPCNVEVHFPRDLSNPAQARRLAD